LSSDEELVRAVINELLSMKATLRRLHAMVPAMVKIFPMVERMKIAEAARDFADEVDRGAGERARPAPTRVIVVRDCSGLSSFAADERSPRKWWRREPRGLAESRAAPHDRLAAFKGQLELRAERLLLRSSSPLTSSPPGEKTRARKDYTWKTSARDGTGDNGHGADAECAAG
jgi:hypothetical protein